MLGHFKFIGSSTGYEPCTHNKFFCPFNLRKTNACMNTDSLSVEREYFGR